jgi:putative sulfotransferase
MDRPYAKSRQAWDGALVLGTGRCGSTLISRALALHPDVLSLSEFFFNLAPEMFPAGAMTGADFWKLLSGYSTMANALIGIKAEPSEFLYPVDGGGRFDRSSGVPRIATVTLPFLTTDPDGLLDQLAGAVPLFPEQSAAEQYLELFSLLGSWLNRPRWIERSGATGFFADQLVANFPAARYIHLTRGLDATARSMSQHSAFRLIALWGEFINRCGCDVLNGEQPADGIPSDLADLTPDRISAGSFARWDPGIDSFREMAAIQEGSICANLAALPASHVLDLSYEALIEEPVAEFIRLAEFFELDDTAAWAAEAAALVRR